MPGEMKPMPPLALSDEVALDLIYKIGKQTAKDMGDAYKPSPVDPMIEKLVVQMGRLGKKAAKGFYDYPSDGKKRLWPGLAELAPRAKEQPSADDLKTRFLYIQALETALDLRPRDFSTLKNLAVLYQRAGFRLKATEMWERALGSAPDDGTRANIKNHLMSLL